MVANSDYELEGWYNVAVEGGRRWQGKTFNNTTTGKTDKYIQATSYGGTGEKFECWFATPAFEVDQVKDKKYLSIALYTIMQLLLLILNWKFISFN